jgi:hypothetical protein
MAYMNMKYIYIFLSVAVTVPFWVKSSEDEVVQSPPKRMRIIPTSICIWCSEAADHDAAPCKEVLRAIWYQASLEGITVRKYENRVKNK